MKAVKGIKRIQKSSYRRANKLACKYIQIKLNTSVILCLFHQILLELGNKNGAVVGKYHEKRNVGSTFAVKPKNSILKQDIKEKDTVLWIQFS
jgi:hypothetical protein